MVNISLKGKHSEPKSLGRQRARHTHVLRTIVGNRLLLTSSEQIRSKASNFKTGRKKSLFFSKSRPYPGVYKGGTLKVEDQGIISQKKVAHLTYVARLTNISNKDIINLFAGVVRGFLSYYRYCDNLYQISTIVDYHICWSAIFTLGNKHKSSTQKIIPKHSKVLHIVNGEGGTLVSVPTSIELRTLRLEFLTKANIDEEAYKKSSVHMIMKCDRFELLCN